MGGLEDLLALLGGPFVLVTIYGWLRLTRGARVHRPSDPEYMVVTTLAAYDAMGRRASQVELSHLADAVLTSRDVQTPETTPLPKLAPTGEEVTTHPAWSLDAKKLLGLAAGRHLTRGIPLIEAMLVELQRCEDATVAGRVAGARARGTAPSDGGAGPAVVLHNDDTTTMDAVVRLLMTYAGHDRRQATYLMLRVHHHGQATVPDLRRDAARPLADALELGAYDLKMRRLKMTVEPQAA